MYYGLIFFCSLWTTCWIGGFLLGHFWILWWISWWTMISGFLWWISWWTMMDLMMDYDGFSGYMMLRLIYVSSIGDFKHISESMTCGLFRTHIIWWIGYENTSLDGMEAKVFAAVFFSSILQYFLPTESISQLVMLWVIMLVITTYIFSHIWPDLSGMMKKSLLWWELMIIDEQ